MLSCEGGGSASWKKNRGAPAVISAVVETLLVAESLHYYTRSSDFLLFPFRHFSLVVLRKREREREKDQCHSGFESEREKVADTVLSFPSATLSSGDFITR